MKALVFNGPRDIRYERFEDPRIRDQRNVIVRVSHCSVCGSDLHMYHGGSIGPMDYSKPGQRFCTGHETIGEVVEVGSAVRKHRVGDRVLVGGGAGCGECQACLSGRLNNCRFGLAYGISPQLQGGQAEYLEVVNADLGARLIPDDVTDEQAILLTDALSTGYYGARVARVTPGAVVAVLGQGPVGRLAAECAMAMGASRVFTVDPVEIRREQSRLFGAEPLHPSEAKAYIEEQTRGLGVDAVIEAVGKGETMSLAVELTRLGGNIAIMGIIQAGTVIPMDVAQMKSVSVHATLASVMETWPELIALLQAGRIKGNGLFTHRFSLSDGAEAYRMFDAQEDGVMKVMINL